MKITKFKNGNFNVQRDKYDSNILESSIWFDCCNSIELDFSICGDEYCVSNFEMAADLYNAHTDMLYRITFTEADDYMKGKMIKLVGRKPDKYEREEINNKD